jgi:hypothetical protein
VPGYRDHAVSLTKDGRSLLESHRDPDHEHSQTFYAGLGRERELEHDLQVYRAYEQAEDRRRCNVFFDKLVKRGYAHEIRCGHNRARVYHVHHEPLYFLTGEVSSRYRRPVSPRVAVGRLMMLDAVLGMGDVQVADHRCREGRIPRRTEGQSDRRSGAAIHER